MNKFVRNVFLILLCLNLLNIKALSQNLENLSEQNPVTINGSIGLNLSAYGVSGIESRARPSDYLLSANATLNLYGVGLPFSATIGSNQRDYAQPFNLFGVSPAYKWITMHLGWRSMNFSPYTLAGYNFLGAGLELNPGIFRFGAMYGRFVKATRGDSILTRNAIPSYDRKGYSVKLGIGSQMDYCDLIFLKASDNISSLSDTSIIGAKPCENLVMGVTSRFSLFQGFNIELDGAGSAYTLDMLADEADFSKNSSILQNFKSFFTIRNSTQFTTALQAAAIYRARMYSVKLAYKRIEPDYKSMGAYYTETDVENITLAPSFNFLNNALRLGFSVGVQNDNLMNNKISTTQRVIGSADASYQTAAYGADLKYTTYGITQKPGMNPIVDSVKIARINSSVNVIGRYTTQSDNVINNYLLSCAYQTLTDNNAKTASLTESDNYTMVFTYQSNFLNTNMTLGANINAIQSVIGDNKNVFVGPSVSASKVWDKLNAGVNLGYQFQTVNGSSAGGTLNASVQGSYQLTTSQSLRLDVNAVKVNSSSSESSAFSEYRLNFAYVYNF